MLFRLWLAKFRWEVGSRLGLSEVQVHGFPVFVRPMFRDPFATFVDNITVLDDAGLLTSISVNDVEPGLGDVTFNSEGLSSNLDHAAKVILAVVA